MPTPSRPPSPIEHSLARLSRLLLAYVVGLCALATLAPFRFRLPTQWEVNWYVGLHDVALNLLLMLPGGFLFALMNEPPRRHFAHAVWSLPPKKSAGVTLLQVALTFGPLSMALEATQFLLPGRATSGVDLVANTTGAVFGALLFWRLRPWLSTRLYNELTLQLPLAHLFYLVTLLLITDGLMARGGGVRLWLMAPLGVCGALLAAALYTHRLAVDQRRAPGKAASGIALWFLVCAAPGWLRAPEVGLVCASLVFATALGACAMGFPALRGRRFEWPTLRAIALPFAMYLGWLWHGYTLVEAPSRPPWEVDAQRTYDAVEFWAAMTVLGYASAEALGRSPWMNRAGRTHLAADGRAVLAGALVATLVLVLCQALMPRPAAMRVQPMWSQLLAIAFAVFGAAVYRAELRVVQALSRDPTPSRRAAGDRPESPSMVTVPRRRSGLGKQ